MKLAGKILERTRITNGIFDEHEDLTEVDTAYHRQSLVEVYRQLLHEPSVIDDCCRIFEKTFDEARYVYVGALDGDEIPARHNWTDAGTDWLKGLRKKVKNA